MRELVEAWKKSGIIFRVGSLLAALTLFVYASIKPSNIVPLASSPVLLEQAGSMLSGTSVAASGIYIANPLPDDSGTLHHCSPDILLWQLKPMAGQGCYINFR